MTLDDYKRKSQKKKRYLSNLLTRILITIILIFGILIIINTNPEVKKKIDKYVFKTNFNYAYINKIYNKYFLNLTKEKTLLVSKENLPNYKKYEDGFVKTINKHEKIKNLSSGVVVFVGEKEKYGKTIIIQGSDGIDIWYGNLEKVSVKMYDYVEVDKEIATASNNLYLVFQKDGKYLNYKDVIK